MSYTSLHEESFIYFVCFLKLRFEDDLAITKMYSGEGEQIDFSEVLYPKGNVEDWLLEVERVMRDSLRKIIGDSLVNYVEVRNRKSLVNVQYMCSYI